MRWTVGCLLAIGCTHAGSSVGDGRARELIAVQVDGDAQREVAAMLTAELQQAAPNVEIEDATAQWVALFDAKDALVIGSRFKRFDEPIPPAWPRELIPDWQKAVALAGQIAGPPPYEGDRARVTETLAYDISTVLWNRYLEFRGARASFQIRWYPAVLEVSEVLAGKSEMCVNLKESAVPRLVSDARDSVRICLHNERGSYIRFRETRVEQLEEAMRSLPATIAKMQVPVPEPKTPVDPHLSVSVTGETMPLVPLVCASRPATLIIETRAAPTFGALLEHRWNRSAHVDSGRLECTLTGKSEIQQPATEGVLPFRINEYTLTCGKQVVSARAMMEGEISAEAVSRKLLMRLDAQLCAKD